MKKTFLISFFSSLLVFSLIFGGVYIKFSSSKSQMEKLEEELGQEKTDDEETVKDIERPDLDELLFLLVGVDAADTEEFREREEKGKMTGVRSDTMILCRVNFVDGSINMLSLPRDSRVKVKGGYEKLNSAHSYGGMALLMDTVRGFTNLDVDYYVRVDYDAVKAIVNAIGGVEIEVTEPMHYDNYLELQIDFEPGVYKMNGDRAIEYLRFRENIKADIGRTERQQYFLTELIKQTLTAKNIFALPKLADAYLKYVDTNIGANIILDAMQLAGSLDTGKIRTETLTGHGERLPASDGIIIDYFILDETHMKNTIEDMFGPYLKK